MGHEPSAVGERVPAVAGHADPALRPGDENGPRGGDLDDGDRRSDPERATEARCRNLAGTGGADRPAGCVARHRHCGGGRRAANHALCGRGAESSAGSADAREPLLEAEILARLRLHGVRADEGYETIVRRVGGEVTVFGLFESAERKAAVSDALSGLEGVRADLKTFGEAQTGDDAPFGLREKAGNLPRLAGLAKTREEISALVHEAAQQAIPLSGDLARVLQDMERANCGDRRGACGRAGAGDWSRARIRTGYLRSGPRDRFRGDASIHGQQRCRRGHRIGTDSLAHRAAIKNKGTAN